MSKAMTEASTFFSRSGSFSTHASRTGKNLLDWGEPEQMTPEQEREALRVSVFDINEKIRLINERLKEHLSFKEAEELKNRRKKLAERIPAITEKLSEFNADKKVAPDDIGHFLIQIFKERVTRHAWNLILEEAKRRHAAQFISGVEP